MKKLGFLAIFAGVFLSFSCLADSSLSIDNQASQSVYVFYPNHNLLRPVSPGATSVDFKSSKVCGTLSTCNLYYGINEIGHNTNTNAYVVYNDTTSEFVSVGSCSGSPVCAKIDNPKSLSFH